MRLFNNDITGLGPQEIVKIIEQKQMQAKSRQELSMN